GLALQGYHGVHNRFPSNSPWYTGSFTDEVGNTVVIKNTDRKGSMHVKLMPFLEEVSLFDRLDFSGDIIQQFFDIEELRSAYVSVLRCPSDPYQRLSDDPPTDESGRPVAPHAMTNYGPSIGAQKNLSLQGWCALFRGNEFNTGDVDAPFTTLK